MDETLRKWFEEKGGEIRHAQVAEGRAGRRVLRATEDFKSGAETGDSNNTNVEDGVVLRVPFKLTLNKITMRNVGLECKGGWLGVPVMSWRTPKLEHAKIPDRLLPCDARALFVLVNALQVSFREERGMGSRYAASPRTCQRQRKSLVSWPPPQRVSLIDSKALLA